MRTEIHIDPNLTEAKLILETPQLTPEQQALLEAAAQQAGACILGYQGDRVVRLGPWSVFRFYTSGQRVLAEADQGTYQVRLRIYELEEKLKTQNFIRISQGEIIQLSKVEQFDLGFSGTIQVRLKNGATTYVSRRYVKKLKQALEI